MRVRLDERVLRDGVGFGVVADDGVGDAVDLPLEALDQDAERVAVAAQRAGDELLVGRCGFADRVHSECRHGTHEPLDG